MDWGDLARMAAIVDVFGALTDRRMYKPAMPAEAALDHMRHQMAGQLDEGLLSKFRDMLLDANFGRVNGPEPTAASRA